MKQIIIQLKGWLDKTRAADFLAPAALRLYLAPIFILAGMNKLSNAGDVAVWFGHIGIPAPALMVYVAGVSELLGGTLLIPGIAVRLVTIPLMATMIVAAGAVHWEYGWHVLPETELTMPWEWRQDLIDGAAERRAKARSLLREYGNYQWLTETGGITILKNGIEWAATYFLMLLSLFFTGGGRLSVDHAVLKYLQKP